jgi:O-antigen ligase
MAIYVFAFVACLVPLTTAYQRPPQPAFYNQWLAAVLWGAMAVCAALCTIGRGNTPIRSLLSRQAWRNSPQPWLLLFWLALVVAILFSVVTDRAPLFVQLPALAVLCVAFALTFFIGALPAHMIERTLHAVLAGLLVAALANAAVSLLQQFAPRWYDDVWIAGLAGDRPFGNLRQPNLLALLSLWGLLAAAVLAESTRWRALAFVIALPLFAALWLSGSRAAWLALPLALTCVLLHARAHETSVASNAPSHRRAYNVAIAGVLLFAIGAAAVYAVITIGSGVRAISVEQRLSLWRDVMLLIANAPWFGVGFNQLNFAWTLTPLPNRSADVFDHAHNLPLQLAVELGVPAVIVLFALLAGALLLSVKHSRASWRWPAIGVIAVALWQSLFEYPLWFAHFLLPTAAIAALLARSAVVAKHSPDDSKQKINVRNSAWSTVAIVGTSGFCLVAALWFLQGYQAIGGIYAIANDASKALAAAERTRQHYVYGHYGDYAEIALRGDRAPLDLFARPTRTVIDERLLTSWARAMARAGRNEDAAYLIARAREFAPDAAFERLPIIAPTVSAPHRLPLENFQR